jgi:hypothetical protein
MNTATPLGAWGRSVMSLDRGGEQDAVYVGFSRDGFNFLRSPVRSEAFLPMSTTFDAWNFQNVQSVGGGFLTHTDSLQFYVGARNANCSGAALGCTPFDGRWDGNGTTGSASLRRDGFASAVSTGAGASMLTTEPVVFRGSHFFWNIAYTAAEGAPMVVELLDLGGTVVKASLPVGGGGVAVDSTGFHVLWEDKKGLEDYAGRPVRFRFHLPPKARVYSFWVSRARGGCSDGFVAAGGSAFNSTVDACP